MRWIDSFSFFTVPGTIAAASSDDLTSFFGIALVIPKIVKASYIVVPAGSAYEVFTPTNTSMVIGLPSGSIATPMILPFAGARTPVVNSLSSTRVAVPMVKRF